MRVPNIAMAVLLLTGFGILACRSPVPASDLQARGSSGPAVHFASAGFPVSSYPLNNDAVQKMVLRDNPDEIRAHGWAVLNALTSGDPQGRDGSSGYEALWDEESQPWENKCTLGLGGNSLVCPTLPPASKGHCPLPKPQDPARYAAILEVPRQQQVATGSPANSAPSSGASSFVSSVRYNAKAADFIREHCLYLPDGIAGLTSADQFDTHAVIVKLMWSMPGEKQLLPVWNPAFDLGPEPGIPTDTGKWPQVKVDTSNAGPCPADATFPVSTDSATPSPPPTVPINCFYHRSFPCSFLDNMAPTTMFTAVQYCASGHDRFDLILSGVHIITAEQNDWVWSTFWWTPDPGVDKFHRQQPDAIAHKGQWRFYAMNIAISSTFPREKDGSPHVAFNPYLEGPHPNSTSSNCMYCHSMAVMRTSTAGNQPAITADLEIRSGMPPSCAYKTSPNTPCPMGELLKNDSSYFCGATRTHFLWSVADNQDPDKRNDPVLLQRAQIKRSIRLPRRAARIP